MITKLELNCRRQTLKDAEGKEEEFDLFDEARFEEEFLKKLGSEEMKFDFKKMKEA